MKKSPFSDNTEIKMLMTRVPEVLIERVKAFSNEN